MRSSPLCPEPRNQNPLSSPLDKHRSIERFNRTLLEEWAYVRTYRSTSERTEALDTWLHVYNHHRRHTAIGGLSPIQRVNNLAGPYS